MTKVVRTLARFMCTGRELNEVLLLYNFTLLSVLNYLLAYMTKVVRTLARSMCTGRELNEVLQLYNITLLSILNYLIIDITKVFRSMCAVKLGGVRTKHLI